MELKFGKLLGEDPKLTLAKIMARKANPDVSYLEVEKSFHKNKGKLDESMLNIGMDVNVERELSTDKNLNLSRPVMNKGARPSSDLSLSRPLMRGGAKTVPALNLSRPVMSNGAKSAAELNLSRPVIPSGGKPMRPVEINRLARDVGSKSSAPPNVALRKPDVVQEDDVPDKPSKLRIKPNLILKMRKDKDEDLSDVTLLKKPEAVQKALEPDEEAAKEKLSRPSGKLLDKPDMCRTVEQLDGVDTGLQPPEQRGVESQDAQRSSSLPNEKLMDEENVVSQQAPMLGKPQRLDSSAKEVLQHIGDKNASSKEENHSFNTDMGIPVSAEQEERESDDWKRAENLFHTGERAEVELVSCSGRGFVASFGSLVGFLPYRNLGTKWKFLAFESWLRKKGLDPSLYRQNLSIIGSYDVPSKNSSVESDKSKELGERNDGALTPGMKFEDLLEAYDKEKTKFLSSFVGQRLKVSVLLADKDSRRLMFSGRPKEKEELVERKRSLMAKLSVGDVVKCCIKKITYFGIFVEVEGVSALVHQSEVSWDATLDPSSYYKIGQIVEAKVHQLDYALERIFLSLKEITPDPLMEALESVVGDRTSLGGSLEAVQADIEPWADVESLIEELQQSDGVQSVSKGRFFLSPGLAPTFQVYMASVFDNQYKLLARYGNKVQEVIVQASLDKEQMKAAILTCTNRVQ